MSDRKTLDELFTELLDFNPKRTFYQLMFRNAGWGVMWHEPKRQPEGHAPPLGMNRDEWRQGLVVYRYYPSMRECLEEEVNRIRKEDGK